MTSLPDLPPEVLVACLNTVEDRNDPLLADAFSVEAALDELFPDEDSLSDADVVQMRLRARIQEQRALLAQLKASLANADEDATKMAHVQELIGELLTHIHHLRSGATESEVVVREITRDIRSLDTSKKNIVSAMTTVKRFQMLVNAFDQLTRLAKAKRYRDTANALQAVRELSTFFKSYSAVDRIASLFVGIRELQAVIREQVTADFESSLVSETTPKLQRNILLTDACLVIDALGDDARSSLIDWYCSRELREYRRIFRPTDEAGQLDNLARRFAWFRRILKQHDDDRAAVFPQSWKIDACLVGTFASITRDDLKVVLSRASQTLSVSTLLESLQITIDYEREMVRRFGQGFESHAISSITMTTGQPAPMTAAFEPYLGIFVDAQDRALSEMLQSYRKPLPSLPSSSADAEHSTVTVLPSSTELFYYYRETLERCAKLTTKQPFLDLCTVYKKWLRLYADDVLSHALVPTPPKRSSSSEARVNQQDLANACLVLNTADYCAETSSQLEERLRERIHPSLRDRVSLESEKELFVTIIANALTALLRELDFAIEPAFSAMSRSPWATHDFVSSESAFVTDLITTINGVVGSVRQHVEQRKYLRSFADRVVALVMAKMTATLVKCRPISPTGAEQLLLDLQTLNRCLNRLPASAREDAIPTTYTRSVARQVGRLDTILKGIMTPEEPAEEFVKNYLIIIPCQSFGDFQKMLDLKGVRRTDQNSLLDLFLARTSSMTDLADTSVLTSLDMNPSATSTSLASAGLNAPSSMIGTGGATTPLSGFAALGNSPFGAFPMSRDNSRAPTPFDVGASVGSGISAMSEAGKQQFDLRRFGQGIRAGVRLFGRDGATPKEQQQSQVQPGYGRMG